MPAPNLFSDIPMTTEASIVRLALPKGRMETGVFKLMADAGISLRAGSRGYRPTISLQGWETKILKPQNIVEMLHAGIRDVGFAGADWVREKNADLVDIMDTELDPVRIVAAAPRDILIDGALPKQHLRIASEYEALTRNWITAAGLDASFVRSYGATEVFPPEDADIIVDNTATGATLSANGLAIVHEVMRSSTRLYASKEAWADAHKRAELEKFAMLLTSVIEARRRVMLEVNVTAAQLEAVVAVLPCMREPTISTLHGDAGFAIKSAVPRKDLARVIPQVRAAGGTDIVVYELSQIVP
ncbi:ATP phosphoribosyltransferase [bacterium]|nr:ATP phosphoribosyltransferase [bacterium]